MCKIQKCADCKTSGILGCDKCEKGYIFEETSETCEFDTSCAVADCDDCSGDREVCKVCSNGLTLRDNRCLDERCKDPICAKCEGDVQVCQ